VASVIKAKLGFVLIFMGLCQTGLTQSKQKIDSINVISFKEKLKKAEELDEVFLKNASEAKKINYYQGEAESYSNLSLVYYYKGKYEKDIFYSLKAISIFEKIDSKEKLAIEYGELGYRLKKRNIKKAQIYMQRGLKIAQQFQLQKPLLSLYNNYGVLKELQNQVDSALFFYTKGLYMKEKIRDTLGIPYSLNNIAGIYLIQKKYDKAEVFYTKALAIRQKIKDEVGISENLSNFGDLYFAQKKYNKAIEYYQKTIQQALSYHYMYLVQYGYQKKAECYEFERNSDSALVNFKKYTQLKDSLFTKESNSKIAELEIKYDSNKKEKLVLQKEIEIKKSNNKLMLVSLLAFFLALIGVLVYRQQRIKNKQQEQEYELKSAISKIETQFKLQEQRLQISRDLHDNIGSQLTFIISSVDNIKYAFELKNSKLDNKLSSISNFAKLTIVELRDTIWAMNSSEISFEDLQTRIHNFIDKAKEAKEKMQFSFYMEDHLKEIKFTSIEGMNLYRTVQEAINNSIKYAEANSIKIDIKSEKDLMIISIQDNGKGFDVEKVELGNGIKNMKKRIHDINGEIEFKTNPKTGTEITIKVKNIRP
jgi:signal transduction histidine kinase